MSIIILIAIMKYHHTTTTTTNNNNNHNTTNHNTNNLSEAAAGLVEALRQASPGGEAVADIPGKAGRVPAEVLLLEHQDLQRGTLGQKAPSEGRRAPEEVPQQAGVAVRGRPAILTK